MEIVQIVGIVFAVVVILILAYLYRESAIIEGKSEIAIGPVKLKLASPPRKDDTPQGLVETAHSAVLTAGDTINQAEHASKE
jgi:hypothetical protein